MMIKMNKTSTLRVSGKIQPKSRPTTIATCKKPDYWKNTALTEANYQQYTIDISRAIIKEPPKLVTKLIIEKLQPA